MHRLRWRTKRTRDDPLGDRIGFGREVVWAYGREELRVLLGLGSERELRAWLLQRRAEGLLVHDQGRLTKRVAFEKPGSPRGVRHHRMVVLRLDPRDAGRSRVRPPGASRPRTRGKVLGSLARELSQ